VKHVKQAILEIPPSLNLAAKPVIRYTGAANSAKLSKLHKRPLRSALYNVTFLHA
jgi:hypothetical protein